VNRELAHKGKLNASKGAAAKRKKRIPVVIIKGGGGHISRRKEKEMQHPGKREDHSICRDH